MQTHNFIEMDYPRVNDVLEQDPGLYRQIIAGLFGVTAALAGFMALIL